MGIDEGPLTPAERELTYSSFPSIKVDTLGDQDLRSHCPLPLPYRRGESRHGLGALEVLPVEILAIICAHLDLHSIMSLQRVNRRAFDMVKSLPQLKSIMQHCPDLIRAILSTKLVAPLVTCDLLFNKLTSAACEICSDFAGYLYLLACMRLCYFCFTQLPEYLPILRIDARRQYGLSANDIKLLPQITSVPGRYTIVQKPCRTRIVLIDPGAARLKGIAVHGSASAMQGHVKDLAALKMRAFHKRSDIAAEEKGARLPRAPRQDALYDEQQYNARRFMAIVPVPFIDTQRGGAEWGFGCYGCLNHFGVIINGRRQYIAAYFRRHLREAGEIIDRTHVGSLC